MTFKTFSNTLFPPPLSLQRAVRKLLKVSPTINEQQKIIYMGRMGNGDAF